MWKRTKFCWGWYSDYLNILKEKGVYKTGIGNEYYRATMKKAGLDPDIYGPILFKNYNDNTYYLVRPEIISLKTLKQALIKGDLIQTG